MATITSTVLLLSKALVSTICLPKKPVRGGKPTNENILITRHKANKGLIEKYPFNWLTNCIGELFFSDKLLFSDTFVWYKYKLKPIPIITRNAFKFVKIYCII